MSQSKPQSIDQVSNELFIDSHYENHGLSIYEHALLEILKAKIIAGKNLSPAAEFRSATRMAERYISHITEKRWQIEQRRQKSS